MALMHRGNFKMARITKSSKKDPHAGLASEAKVKFRVMRVTHL